MKTILTAIAASLLTLLVVVVATCEIQPRNYGAVQLTLETYKIDGSSETAAIDSLNQMVRMHPQGRQVLFATMAFAAAGTNPEAAELGQMPYDLTTLDGLTAQEIEDRAWRITADRAYRSYVSQHQASGRES